MQLLVLLLYPLFSNIFRYAVLISKFTHAVYKISITPKFSAPQYLLHLRPKPKYFLRRNALYYRYYFCWTHPGYRLYQKMNMVFIHPNLEKMNIVSLRYSQTYFFQYSINGFAKYHPPVFCRAYKMV